MRDQRPLWRPIVATFGALVVVLSAMGCDPPSAGEADPRPAAEVQPNDTQPPAEADATPAPVEEAAVPTQPPVREPEPRTTPMVEVGITRPPAEVHVTRPPVEIDGAGSACSPNWDRPEWLFREFVQWTPDGSTVLFTDGPHIYAVAADGSRLWDVAVPAAGEGKPVGPMAPFTVSPDGKQVIYATCNYGRSSELARVGVDGTQPQQLTVNSRFESHPAWSPDGKRIAFLAAAQVSGGASDLRPRLYTMAPDGSDTRPVRMAAAAELLPLPPQWSPDSKHIAYTQREVGGRVGLYTVAVDGRDPPQRLSATVSSASWSPDGTRIAFAKPEPDTVSLFTIAVGGWDAQRLRTMPLNHWRPRPRYAAAEPSRAWIETVAWSPDGSKILYSCHGICVVDLDNEPVVNASPAEKTSSAQDDLDPLPSGTAEIHRTVRHGNLAAWSPNGSRIATMSTEDPNPNRYHNSVVQTMAADGSDMRVLIWAALGGPIAAESGHDDLASSQAACSAGLVVEAPWENPGLVRDCEVLLELRDDLFHKPVNWGPGAPITRWLDVTVAGAPLRVTGLILQRRVRTGLLPAGLSNLTQLRMLHLSYDRSYYGGPAAPIPPELGDLSQLRVLKIGGILRGGIPAELGQLTNLRILSLTGSQLTGAIPPDLGRLTNLQELFLYSNKLTGTIPPDLSQLTNLTAMSLSSNQLTGAIPSELGQLANLTLLDLASNQLTGTIPPALGQLGNLTRLILFYNQLTGPIPAELGQLGSLTELILYGNQIAGPIPPKLSQLTNLTALNIVKNQLAGPIPPELGQLANLRSLNLVGNQLTGPIPPELGQLANLNTLRLDNNQLVGAIPAEIGQLTNLGTLGLSGNSLTGEVPVALGRLNASLWLAGNQLTGCIPLEIAEWRIGDRSDLGLPKCDQR